VIISLAGLNRPQRQAAETVEGPVLILAGAGSGKTRTITYRMAHMVANLKINPKQILAVTFTNKAAKEMRERVSALLGSSKGRGLTISTFHALCVRILKREIQNLGYHQKFNIYDTGDQLAIIREALNKYTSEKDGGFERKTIQSKISFLKNRGISPTEYPTTPYYDPESPYDQAIEHCYHYYQEKMRFYNAIDFDDILFLTIELFRKHPHLAKHYSEKYNYIMIDEYQDTNGLQFELVTHLTCLHKNLCVVGDDDQAIYGFRGADVSNILNFEQNYPNCKVIKLEENYRSTNSILQLANKVIAQNTKRKDKTLFSQKNTDDRPVVWACGSTEHEAESVVEDILQFWSTDGGHLSEVAILYRSKTQVAAFEEQLRLSQIPYKIIGGQKLYEKKEVKDIMAYLSFLNNPKDELALRRIINIPHRGIGNATLEKYLALKTKDNTDLYQAFKNNPSVDPKRAGDIQTFTKLVEEMQHEFNSRSLPEALGQLIEKINYFSFIDQEYKDAPKQAEKKKVDVNMFMQLAERFVQYHKQNATLNYFVEKIILQDSQDDEEHSDLDDDLKKNEVTLMTLHSAKGLEFDRVYFVGAEEEILPHKKSMAEGTDLNEELRLCYVGITRAREKLVLTYCKERKLYGKNVRRNKSRFLHNLEEGLFDEKDRTVFGHLSPEEAESYKKKFFQGLIEDL